MMLVTTIDQVRAVIGSAIRKENTLEILKPYLDRAQINLITSLIGSAQVDALSGSLTGKPAELQRIVTEAIVWNGYQDAWFQGFYQFSSSGINRQNVKDTEALFRYQEDNIQKGIVRKADEALERLMLFLEQNITDFPLYKSSPEFSQNFKYLIASPAALQAALPEVSRSYRMYNVLRGFMNRIESSTVKQITGSALYFNLKMKVATGAEMDENFKELLQLSQNYAAPAALLEAMPWIRVQFSTGGIRILSVFNNLQDEKAATDEQAEALMANLRQRIVQAKSELRVFLNKTASETVFEDYFHSDLYAAPGSKLWIMPNNEGKKHFRI